MSSEKPKKDQDDSLRQELEGAYRDYAALAHAVSHDLRAPLRAVEGFASLVARTQRGKLDADGEEHLRMLAESTKELRNLFEGLVSLSRIGSQPLRRRPCGVEELASSVVADRREDIVRKAASVHVGTLPPAEGDPALVRHLLAILIDNALKFSSPERAPTIEIGAEPGTPPVYFVRDDGLGFDMRESERLFSPFQRLHDPRTFEGSGIGLAMAASIVQRHGGRIWAESSPGCGATFRWTLAPAAA